MTVKAMDHHKALAAFTMEESTTQNAKLKVTLKQRKKSPRSITKWRTRCRQKGRRAANVSEAYGPLPEEFHKLLLTFY
jgi:hypothetical protein